MSVHIFTILPVIIAVLLCNKLHIQFTCFFPKREIHVREKCSQVILAKKESKKYLDEEKSIDMESQSYYCIKCAVQRHNNTIINGIWTISLLNACNFQRKGVRMDNDFDSNTPIYLQLVKLFTIRIAGGEWKAGDRVMSVRDLAVEYKVNPNTVQRALSELERDGLVYTERTSGRYITGDKDIILKARSRLVDNEVAEFVRQMKQLGYSREQWIALVEETMKKENT